MSMTHRIWNRYLFIAITCFGIALCITLSTQLRIRYEEHTASLSTLSDLRIHTQSIENGSITDTGVFSGSEASVLLRTKKHPTDIHNMTVYTTLSAQEPTSWFIPCFQCDSQIEIPILYPGMENHLAEKVEGPEDILFYSKTPLPSLDKPSLEEALNDPFFSGKHIFFGELILHEIASSALLTQQQKTITRSSTFSVLPPMTVYAYLPTQTTLTIDSAAFQEKSSGIGLEIRNMDNAVLVQDVWKKKDQIFTRTYTLPVDGVYKIILKAPEKFSFTPFTLTVPTEHVTFFDLRLPAESTITTSIPQHATIRATIEQNTVEPITLTSADTVISVSTEKPYLHTPQSYTLSSGEWVMRTSTPARIQSSTPLTFSSTQAIHLFPWYIANDAAESDVVVSRANITLRNDASITSSYSLPQHVLDHISLQSQHIQYILRRTTPQNYSATRAPQESTLTISSPEEFSDAAHTLPWTIRDDGRFLLYINNGLSMRITKTDINAQKKEDEVIIRISDMSGETVFAQKIADDGITSASRKTTSPQYLDIDLPYIHGIYMLSIEHVNQGNQHSDTLISNITLNSNAITSIGSLFITEPTTLYATPKETTTSQVYTESYTTSLSINDDERLLTPEKKEKITLQPGTYTLRNSGPILFTDAVISSTPFQWIPDTLLENTDIIPESMIQPVTLSDLQIDYK